MKDLPPRSTRGKRMNDLLGEEKDYDGYFWGQTMFQETVTDEEYVTESEKEDKFDEDFYHIESSEDETEVKPEKEEKIDKQLPIKHEKPMKRKKKKLKIEKTPGITQKEMLEQAAIIEMYNAHDLTKLLTLEENSKINLLKKREKFLPTYRYSESLRSGKRKATIWHSEPLPTTSSTKPVKRLCEITGLPARYKDPLTGKYYSTKEAFKKIRDIYYAEKEKDIMAHISRLEETLSTYN